MRLEYLPDGLPDCHLIRLFSFTPAEAAGFGALVADLAGGRIGSVVVHALLGARPFGGCQLTLVRSPRDRGVMQIGPNAFECGLTAAAWDNIAGLIEPFALGAGGYQWLSGIPGSPRLLLSCSGEW